MDPVNFFLSKHPNISEIFPESWFESELKKTDPDKHLLAKQFDFKDTEYHRSISYHLFNHLEEELGILRYEIQQKKSIVKNLRNSREYVNLIGQIEIASMFKQMGFDIELEPGIPESERKSDIKVMSGDFTAFFEVRTIHDREGKEIPEAPKSEFVEIRTIEYHPIPNIKDIIFEKMQQLSENHCGILVINLDNISRTLHFEEGFYESAKECPVISGMMLYRHYFNNEGCRILSDYFANPYANNPLPERIEQLLGMNGITISTWSNEI